MPFAQPDACVWSFLLGPAITIFGVNRIYGIEGAKDIQMESDKRADALTRLLHVAERKRRLVSVTLDSRKRYVGFVAETPNLNPEEKYFRILPILSGFRDKDTLETVRTVFYDEVTQAANSSDFVITLPIADVKTANLFDPDSYERHFADTEDDRLVSDSSLTSDHVAAAELAAKTAEPAQPTAGLHAG